MNSIPEIIEDIRSGRMVILVDDEDRENEGDLIMAADFITPQAINFMASEAKGLICLAMTHEQTTKLGIPMMVQDGDNLSPNKTAFTVSIEASRGVSTGISAADRAHTVRVAANPAAQRSDIIMPGHIFPIRAQEGGVLKRAGHTEASVDLATLAGLNSSAVICEIMNADGSMARVPELKEFAADHDIKIGTIEALIEYRLEHESLVKETARAPLPTRFGEGFEVVCFENILDGKEHLAIIKGPINIEEPTLVRVQTESVMGDVFGDLRSNSGEYLQESLAEINRNGSGVLLYLRLESMGRKLVDRIKSYSEATETTSPEKLAANFRSDKKDYGVGAQILRALGLREIRLITNNPSKRVGLKGYGLEIVDSLSLNVKRELFDSLTPEKETSQ